MNIQEIINELTRSDRLVITNMLVERAYSRRYVAFMFEGGRRRTWLFRRVVRAYWENKQGLTGKVDELVQEFNDKRINKRRNQYDTKI